MAENPAAATLDWTTKEATMVALEDPVRRVVPSRYNPVVVATNVTRRYGEGTTAVEALRGVSLSLEHGEFVALMGRQGQASRHSSTCSPVWTSRRRARCSSTALRSPPWMTTT